MSYRRRLFTRGGLKKCANLYDILLLMLGCIYLNNRDVAYKTWGYDDQFFISRALEMIKAKVANFKLASREATLSFGAIGSAANTSVIGVSGTLSALSNDDRESFFAYCPELKTIFPALHDPHCFGASSVLDKDKCSASICALQDRSLHKGGC